MASDEDDEVKSHFCTKEGHYTVVRKQGLSRPDKTPFITPITLPVRLSFVTLKDGSSCENRIAFNVDREILVYRFGGASCQPPHDQNPLNRRVWKGHVPLCHDFNLLTRSPENLDLLIGLTLGHVQIFDPIRKEILSQYNDTRQVDKSHASALKWVPGSDSLFVVGHLSGCLYVYQRDLPNSSHPHYSCLHQAQSYSIYANKSKQKNPLQRWCIGSVAPSGQRDGEAAQRGSSSSTAAAMGSSSAHAINDLAFSPDCKHLAVGSQDGYMRVFDFERQRMVCSMRSYFGGITCVAWSPDGRYIVTGSQDDLVAVYSFHQRRLVARGHAHCCFISAVAFDPYNTSPTCRSPPKTGLASRGSISSDNDSDCAGRDTAEDAASDNIFYRFGSVGQDGRLTLWDLGGDILGPAGQVNCGNHSGASLSSVSQAPPSSRGESTPAESTVTLSDSVEGRGSSQANGDLRASSEDNDQASASRGKHSTASVSVDDSASAGTSSTPLPSTSHSSQSMWKRASHIVRRGHKSRGRNSSGGFKHSTAGQDDLVEAPPVYSMHDVPLMSALVCKRVAHERLCAIAFCQDCIVVATQNGFVEVFARPTETSEDKNGVSLEVASSGFNSEKKAETKDDASPAPQSQKKSASSAV